MTKNINNVFTTGKSSIIKQVVYQEQEGDMYVTFTNDNYCVFRDVPVSVFEAFGDAESAGKFFNSEVKWSFDYEKLEPLG